MNRLASRSPLCIGTRTSALLLLVLLMLVPRSGAAQGLASAPGSTDAPGLRPLDRLAIDAELHDDGATIEEVRGYSGIAEGDELIFYRPLPAGATLRVTLNGEPLDGDVLDAPAADELRRSLVLALRQPAPLRDLGTPLFVSRPVSPPAGTVEIAVSTELSLATRGTLRGTAVPLDWHEREIGVVEIDVSATSSAPLRALYAPYHELAVTRDGEHLATGH
jgi:hypothetical protein